MVADLDRRSEAEKKKRQMQVLFSLAAFIPLLFSFSFSLSNLFRKPFFFFFTLLKKLAVQPKPVECLNAV